MNDQKPEVVEVEAVEVVDILPGDFYTGRILTVNDGYCFIGGVRRGYETIATNGDVFCPVVAGSVKVGDLVQFTNLNPDPERQGKFRTESLTVIGTGLAVRTNSSVPMIAALAHLSKAAVYHQHAKKVDPAQAQKALENMPFKELLGRIQDLKNLGTPANLQKMVEDFITASFANLIPFGVSYSIEDEDHTAEARLIGEKVSEYQAAGMEPQAETIRREYERLSGVRRVFTLMKQNNILRFDTVIPLECLPELFMMAPVWFVDSKIPFKTSDDTADDPMPDHSIRFFSDCVGSKQFAWLYQVYNRRHRPIAKFDGRDIIPPALLTILQSARTVFDYTVIATPYHDIASREWADPEWMRNIDPFLLGFMQDLPFIFVLGRWSGTGIFPLALEMMADTVNHLKINQTGLKKFPNSSYWYKGDYGACLGGSSDNLFGFAGKLIRAFEEGQLFRFLRGEGK